MSARQKRTADSSLKEPDASVGEAQPELTPDDVQLDVLKSHIESLGTALRISEVAIGVVREAIGSRRHLVLYGELKTAIGTNEALLKEYDVRVKNPLARDLFFSELLRHLGGLDKPMNEITGIKDPRGELYRPLRKSGDEVKNVLGDVLAAFASVRYPNARASRTLPREAGESGYRPRNSASAGSKNPSSGSQRPARSGSFRSRPSSNGSRLVSTLPDFSATGRTSTDATGDPLVNSLDRPDSVLNSYRPASPLASPSQPHPGRIVSKQPPSPASSNYPTSDASSGSLVTIPSANTTYEFAAFPNTPPPGLFSPLFPPSQRVHEPTLRGGPDKHPNNVSDDLRGLDGVVSCKDSTNCSFYNTLASSMGSLNLPACSGISTFPAPSFPHGSRN